jgi:hypothetical protein
MGSNATLKYKSNVNRDLPLMPFITSRDKKGGKTNRSGVIVNDGRANFLAIQLVNTSNSEITISEKSEWTMQFANSAKAPFAITDKQEVAEDIQVSETEDRIQISGHTFENQKAIFRYSSPVTESNTITVVLNPIRPFTVQPFSYIQINLDNLKTNISPRTGLIVLSYEDIEGYNDGQINIQIPIQPLVFAHDGESSYAKISAPKGFHELKENSLNFYSQNKENGELKKKVQITSDTDGGILYIRDSGEKEMIKLTSGEKGGLIRVKDKNEKTILFFYSGDNGGYIDVQDKSEKEMVTITSGKKGGLIQVKDKSEKTILFFYSSDNGGFIDIQDKNEKEMVTITSGEKGGLIKVKDKSENNMLYFYSDDNGGFLNIKDKSSNDIIKVNID